MRRPGVMIMALAFMTALAGTSHAYTFESSLLYMDENGSGYRQLTSAEPAAGGDLPLSFITIYPESDINGGFDLSFSEEEGPWLDGTNTTLILHTKIPFTP
jgi:hypothetical protein